MTETWKPVYKFEHLYQASDLGNIWTNKNNRLMRPTSLKSGYRIVRLSRNGISYTKLISNLVLEAFVSPRPNGLECCHNDGNNTNDALVNLRWDTHSSNQIDQVRHGTHSRSIRTHCPRLHKLQHPNLQYKTNGGRQCLACVRAFSYRQRNGGNIEFLSDQFYDRIMSGSRT